MISLAINNVWIEVIKKHVVCSGKLYAAPTKLFSPEHVVRPTSRLFYGVFRARFRGLNGCCRTVPRILYTVERENKIPYMICESHGVKIRCQSLMEAEQRARIHMNECEGYEAIWRFE